MRTIFQTIAARHYRVTDDQLARLAKDVQEAGERIGNTNATYLRVLAAGTQEALGLQPRMRASRKNAAYEQSQQLAALGETHGRMYAVILAAVTTPDIAERQGLRMQEKKRRALERNARSNFARTAKAVLHAYVKAGGNVGELVIPTLTKSALRAYVEQRKAPADKAAAIAQQAERLVANTMQRIEALKEEDGKAAQSAAQKLILQLTDISCDKFTTSPSKSVKHGIPLRLEVSGTDEMFLPLPAANEQGFVELGSTH